MGTSNKNDEIASALYMNREMVKMLLGERYDALLKPWREALRNVTKESGKPMALVTLSIAKNMEAGGQGSTAFILAAFVDELDSQKEAPGVIH